MKNLTLIILFILLTAMSPKHEKDYQKEFCINGIMEYELDDKTRVDCLTDEYAIEIDWGKKWAECIGQALYYGLKTGKKPACALIINSNDIRYLNRLKTVARQYNIKIFIIKNDKKN